MLNLHLVFTHTPMCVNSTVYSVLSRVLWKKNITGMLLGWDKKNTYVLKPCSENLFLVYKPVVGLGLH